LIHRKGFDHDQAMNIIKDLIQLEPILQIYETGLTDALKAISRAKSMHWLDQFDDLLDFDFGMSRHYADPAHGNIQTIFPGQLLLFPTPAALPPGESHADVAAPGRPPTRHFSPAYLADVLADMGVATAVCLGRFAAAARAALLAAGIAAHDLDGGGAAALAGALAAARGSGGGAVAVCSGGRGWPAGALGVGAGYLVERGGFEEGAAMAWVGMACGAAAAAADSEADCDHHN
jgi:hypothetical protein